MKKNKNVLFVAAHPDDETLGCGGSILKHKKSGDKVYWLIITDMLRSEGFTEERIRARHKEIGTIAAAYGFSGIFKLNLPTAKLDRVPMSEIISQVDGVIKKTKAEVIYLPHAGDIHTDHQITHRAVVSSAKSFKFPQVKRILAYETVSETEFAAPRRNSVFLPNVFTNVTPFMDKKLSLMKLYKGEVKPFPFPRSIKNLKALAAFRGSRMGARYAEAFMLINEFI